MNVSSNTPSKSNERFQVSWGPFGSSDSSNVGQMQFCSKTPRFSYKTAGYVQWLSNPAGFLLGSVLACLLCFRWKPEEKSVFCFSFSSCRLIPPFKPLKQHLKQRIVFKAFFSWLVQALRYIHIVGVSLCVCIGMQWREKRWKMLQAKEKFELRG